MNDTQIETLNWYKQNSSKFKNIEFKRTLKDFTEKFDNDPSIKKIGNVIITEFNNRTK